MSVKHDIFLIATLHVLPYHRMVNKASNKIIQYDKRNTETSKRLYLLHYIC